MTPPKVLISEEDRSVNFVFDNGQEARYVRRSEDYAIVYLSSHGGCNQACRFCHLTQTKQVEMRPASVMEMFLQAKAVLAHYSEQVRTEREWPVKYLNFNWMARGEPLLNEQLIEEWSSITLLLRAEAQRVGVDDVRFNISTILPASDGYPEAIRAVEELLCTEQDWQRPTLYYSLYSLSHDFRRRWLPKAMEPEEALNQLTLIQRFMGLRLVIHHCLIEGENDSVEDAKAIADAMELYRLSARFNLVRYNPYSPVQGKEPPEDVFVAYFQAITPGMKVPGSRIVPRVGFDVKASCGMFVELQGK